MINSERPINPLARKLRRVPTADYLALTNEKSPSEQPKEFARDDEIQQFIKLYNQNQIFASNIGDGDEFAYFLLRSKDVDGEPVWFKISQKKLVIAQELLKFNSKQKQSSGKYATLVGRISQQIFETVKENLLNNPHS